MKNELGLNDFLVIIKGINQAIQDNTVYLSKLDSTVGDGDHGTTIARGFRSAVKKNRGGGPEMHFYPLANTRIYTYLLNGRSSRAHLWLYIH